VLAACVTRSRNDERGPQEILTRILYARLEARARRLSNAVESAAALGKRSRRRRVRTFVSGRGQGTVDKLWWKPWPAAPMAASAELDFGVNHITEARISNSEPNVIDEGWCTSWYASNHISTMQTEARDLLVAACS
jgi:hypothetical protein